MSKIKVIIADDIKILRQGLKIILEQDSDIEVLALAENGKEAFELTRDLKPDVVLMDMRMPEYDGAYGIAAIKKECPGIKALVLTTFDDKETIDKAIRNGADGYILKEMEDEKIIASVKSVYNGINVFGQGVYQVMLNSYHQVSDTDAMTGKEALSEVLTKREMEVVKLLQKEIIVSGRKEYLSNAMKLYCRSVFDALNDGDISLIKFYKNEL